MKSCDICGRTETDLSHPLSGNRSQIPLDEDGLWICQLCKNQITSTPVGAANNPELHEELRPLIGKSAGAICRTLELPNEPPYQSVIEAASIIGYDQDLYMSAWLFVDQFMDGTCIWRSEDGTQTALVAIDGKVKINKSSRR